MIDEEEFESRKLDEDIGDDDDDQYDDGIDDINSV
jgi:hypothetical protein